MANSPTENSQLSTEFSAFTRGGHHTILPASHQVPPMFSHPLNMASFVAGRAPPASSVLPNPYITAPPTMINPLCNMANPLESGVKPPAGFSNPTYMNRFDQIMQCWPHGFRSLDMPGGVRSTKASRESTSYLKAWLYKHKKNPYPTKNQKIWLACITNMTLTQVSTWFANARRRIKKELASGKHPHYDQEGDMLPDDMPNEPDSPFAAVGGKEIPFTTNDTKYRIALRQHQEQNKFGEASHRSPPQRTSINRTPPWDAFSTSASRHAHQYPHPHKLYPRSGGSTSSDENRLRIRSQSDVYSRKEEDEEQNISHGSSNEDRREEEDLKQDKWRNSSLPQSPEKPKSPFVKITSKTLPQNSFTVDNSSPSNKNKIWSLAQVASESHSDDEKPSYEKSKFCDDEVKSNVNRISPPLPHFPRSFPPQLDGNNNPAMTNNFIQLMMAKMAEQNALAWMQDMHKYIPPEHLKATKEAFANALTSSLMSSLSSPQWREGAPMFRGSVMARMAPICKEWQNESESKASSTDDARDEVDFRQASNSNAESSPRSIVTSSPDYGSRASPDCKS